jgi:RNA polymerase sigma-70 factor (ECF subfamily)
MKSVQNLVATDDEWLIPTRATLLSRLKNWSDQESWNTFFETYWRLIYSAAIKAGLSKEDAEDVVQETVIAVCRSMPDFKYEAGSFKGWLLQLTRWRIGDQLRKRGPEEPLSGTELPEWQVPALDAIWDEEWDRNLINAALERLKRRVSPRQFQIFDLHVLQKVPVAKVRSALHVTSGAVYLAKHRLCGLLKKEMARLEKHVL